MESKTGVSITIPNIPNLFTILIIILLRRVNLRAGIILGKVRFRNRYILVLSK